MAVSFENPTEKIMVGKDGGYFTVRGLNSEDVTYLTVNYLDDIKRAVAKQTPKPGKLVPSQAVTELVKDLATQFPMLCVEIISRAADADAAEDIQKFRMLAFVKQLEALQKIVVLTTSDGVIDLKNLFGVVANLLDANGFQVGPQMSRLMNTIAGSGNQSPT